MNPLTTAGTPYFSKRGLVNLALTFNLKRRDNYEKEQRQSISNKSK